MAGNARSACRAPALARPARRWTGRGSRSTPSAVPTGARMSVDGGTLAMRDPRTQVLIIDDEPASKDALCALLAGEGYVANSAKDGAEALNRLLESAVPLVICEAATPRLGAMDLLRALALRRLPTSVVVLTSRGSIDSAVAAMRQGAFDYLTKPVDPQRLLHVVPSALEAYRVRSALHALHLPDDTDETPVGSMIGTSAAARAMFSLVQTVAPSRANVLVLGESGTGKELVARGIHELSTRSSQRFVSVNCAALPP